MLAPAYTITDYVNELACEVINTALYHGCILDVDGDVVASGEELLYLPRDKRAFNALFLDVVNELTPVIARNWTALKGTNAGDVGNDLQALSYVTSYEPYILRAELPCVVSWSLFDAFTPLELNFWLEDGVLFADYI